MRSTHRIRGVAKNAGKYRDGKDFDIMFNDDPWGVIRSDRVHIYARIGRKKMDMGSVEVITSDYEVDRSGWQDRVKRVASPVYPTLEEQALYKLNYGTLMDIPTLEQLAEQAGRTAGIR